MRIFVTVEFYRMKNFIIEVKKSNTSKGKVFCLSTIGEKDKNEITIRNCKRPIQEAIELYNAMKISLMPFTTNKYVVTH